MRIIHVLRKTLSEGTVAANTLRHGTGGLNIDTSRIAHGSDVDMNAVQRQQSTPAVDFGGSGLIGTEIPMYKPGGRWPANVILQHLDGCRCDGVKRVKSGTAYEPAPKAREHSIYGDSAFRLTLGRTVGYADEDGQETVANWICEPGCPVARLDEQSGISGSTTEGVNRRGEGGQFATSIYGKAGPQGRASESRRNIVDSGGASRFYKQVGGEK